MGAAQGWYFVSGGGDKYAKFWYTELHRPLRIFNGHKKDVEKVAFHPNLHYVITGSSDKTIRMWSVEKANWVRIFIHGTGILRSLITTIWGKYILWGSMNQFLIFRWKWNNYNIRY